MKTTVQIQNLKCNGCATTIKNNLQKLENIQNIEIELETSSVSFEYITESDLKVVEKELHHLGYPLEGEENKFQTKAKSFVSCAVGRMNK
jgi:copper chaperone CopZ